MDAARLAAAATAAAIAEDEVQQVNFLSPEELAQQVYLDDARGRTNEDTYTQEVAQEARYQSAVKEHNAAMADHRRRVQAKKDKAALKVKQARAAKKKRKKMRKKGR